MSKKSVVIIVSILLVGLVIVGLYGTFAASSTVSGSDNVYNITLTGESSEISLPAGSSKTVLYKITNTNKGTVQYGVVFSGDNIEVKEYSDSEDPSSGVIDYGESKFVKLLITNTGSSNSTATIEPVIGYEKGGSLNTSNLVPSGYTFVNNKIEKLTDYITNLYTNAEKTEVTSNGIVYNQAQSVNLMNDRLGNANIGINAGNIRYYGSDPNNYIYFNCSDYNDQSSDTCEKWRIIGVFDDKVKLVRSEPLGSYSWDYSSTGVIENDWNNSTLKTLLNETYYTSKSTTYYNTSTTGITVSFSENGITDATRNNNLISSSTWYINKFDDVGVYTNVLYENEMVSENTWSGNIALLYLSDYGYAADINNCDYVISQYSNCTQYNWMYDIMTNSDGGSAYLLNTSQSNNINAWCIIGSFYAGTTLIPGGGIQSNSKGSAYFVSPVLYLNSSLNIDGSSDGSSGNPYKIVVS